MIPADSKTVSASNLWLREKLLREDKGALNMTKPATNQPDEDMRKGAVEDDTVHPDTSRAQNGSMSGQLGHRDQDPMLKDNDTDFPEPDAEGEHSGK
jgi:hypothetical protein